MASKCIDLKGLELQSTVSRLKLEALHIEAALTLSKENADWQEKSLQDMTRNSHLKRKLSKRRYG